jgi:hypothetical protein
MVTKRHCSEEEMVKNASTRGQRVPCLQTVTYLPWLVVPALIAFALPYQPSLPLIMSHHIDEKPSIDVIIPPSELTEAERLAFFEHFFRRLAAHRNQFQIYAIAESGYILQEGGTPKEKALLSELDHWAQGLLNSAWAACQEPGGGTVPKLDAMSDTSTATLPPLPSPHQQKSLLSTVLFLHITHSKSYSSHTRAFVATFGPIDETGIVNTLKNPDHVAKQAQDMTEQARQKEAEKGKTLRYVGMGLAGLAGGALIGVTGGLAAPLVGTAIGGFLTTIGVGSFASLQYDSYMTNRLLLLHRGHCGRNAGYRSGNIQCRVRYPLRCLWSQVVRSHR